MVQMSLVELLYWLQADSRGLWIGLLSGLLRGIELKEQVKKKCFRSRLQHSGFLLL
jgi:hypothetical protein